MENKPSMDSKCTAPKGQLTGKAVLDSSARMASNMLLRSMRQSRLLYMSLMKPGCLQKSKRPCMQHSRIIQWCPDWELEVGCGIRQGLKPRVGDAGKVWKGQKMLQ